MKVLTKVALGALINRLPEGVHLRLEDKHNQYLASEFIGEPTVWDSEFTHYKHGRVEEVEAWLKSFGFNKSFDQSSQFVIASVLELIVKFQKEAKQKFFKHNDVVYKRSFHDTARETNVDGLYEVSLRGEKIDFITHTDLYRENEDLKFYVSRELVPFDVFKNDIYVTHLMDLHLPDVDAELEEDVPVFKGMGVNYFGSDQTVGSAGVITKFTLDSKGAEAKQAAYMTTFSSCCGIPRAETRHRRIEVIDAAFVVYITYKGELAFAVEVEPSDFVQGDGEVEEFSSREPYTTTNMFGHSVYTGQ